MTVSATTRPVSSSPWLAMSFEDIEPGMWLRTRGRTITETDLVAFSALTGDWNPIHADAEAAAASRYGERVAHGLLILSYAVGLLPIDPDRVVAMRHLRDVTFKRPARLDVTLSAVATVDGCRALSDDLGLVEARLDIMAGGDELLVRAKLGALWRI
jgi:3-hydroxybutyryl-CoA dehydratase